MKRLTGIIISAALLAGCSESQTESVILDEAALKAEVMEGDTAKDFLVTETGAIYVGVLDNGTSRDGYAQYVCEVVRSHASGEGRRLVKIIDIAAVSRGDGFKTLGRDNCEI